MFLFLLQNVFSGEEALEVKQKKKKQYLDKQQEVGVGGGAKEREVFRLFGLSGNSSCFHLLILGLLSCQVREDKWQESKAENMVQR